MQSLIALFSAIALLVWGTHMVRTGFLRVYGANLRKFLRASTGTRLTAMAAGIGVTGLVQSSSATALLTSSFVGQGLIETQAALAVMLGADVGTSLMVQVFALNLSWLSPLFLMVGVILHLGKKATKIGQIGRIMIGLGLMILALQMIGAATKPVIEAKGVHVLFSSLSGDVFLDVLLGAVLAIGCYSSLAVVLLTASLAAAHVIPGSVALPVVLGANLGSCILVVLSTIRASTEARRVPLGNLIFKLAGVAIALPLLTMVGQWFGDIAMEPQRQVIYFHLGFNLALAIVFIGLIGPVARLTERILPSDTLKEAPGKPKYLDPTALQTPSLAMGCAAREALRLGDIVQVMLSGMLSVLRTNDLRLAEELRKMDDAIDDLYTAIKLYLTQLSREALDEREGKRWADIIQFTINMEHAGDIIERILIDVADKKIRHALHFSDAGMAEIEDLHSRLLANLQLGLSVFLNGDLKCAQQLLSGKDQFRALELRYAETHLIRLADNTRQSIETSSLHLDLISDMKRINSLFCSIAYPILDEAGVLAPSRLREQIAQVVQDSQPVGQEVAAK
ncbi:MAG: Na/Pi cotransporter family protein [Betaproteobacteria bacterium]